MQFHRVILAAVILIVCLTQAKAFKPASRLFPMNANDAAMDSESTLYLAENIARQLGAEVTSLKGEVPALAEEAAPSGSVKPHLTKHSEASSFIEHVNDEEAPHAMMEAGATATSTLEAERAVKEEMEHVDYREFLPNHVTSLIEDVEQQLNDPVPELNFIEASTQISKPKLQVVGADRTPYAQLDVKLGGFSQRHVSKAKGVDVYVVNNYDNEVLNEVRPVQPPHPHIYPPYNRRIVPHSPPRPDDRAVGPVTQLNTLSVYETSYQGPEFNAVPFEANSAAAAFLALEASAPAAAKVTSSSIRNLQFDSNGNWIPVGSRPPVIAGMSPGAVTTINSVPYGYRGNYGNGYGSLEPNFPAKVPVSPPRDGPAVRLDDLLPVRADIIDNIDDLNPKKVVATPNWD